MDLHLHDARIWTGWPQRPWARAVTIAGGRVRALDEPAPRGFAGVVLRGGGRVAAPGLIDAHMHLLMGAESRRRLDLSNVNSRADFEAMIARRHRELPPGAWLIGHGWSEARWPGAEAPDKSWLAAAGDRPTVCHRVDLHAVLVNDAVFELLPPLGDAPAGCVARHPVTGEPSGLMLEYAAWHLVNPRAPRPDAAAKRALLLEAQDHCHRLGLTAVGTMEEPGCVLDTFEPMRRRLSLRCRVTLLEPGWPIDVASWREYPTDDRLSVIGFKAFIDGTLGSRTARLWEEYADDPGNRGIFTDHAGAGRLMEWARAVAHSGLSPSMHAIGDQAVSAALDVVEQVPAAARPRIEHAQHIRLADAPRFAGVITSMQPLHKSDDAMFALGRLGPDRLRGMLAFRTLHRAGAKLAFGSDWPVVSCDPLAGIRTAVTGAVRDGSIFMPQECIAVEAALAAYTRGAADALGMEDGGVLRPGALGDLVVFDRDPFGANWLEDPPRVSLTVAGGRVVYDADD